MIKKVAAFVIERGKPERLLVFDDPLTGLQLPAGTVEPGERVEEATRREVREETGIHVRTKARVVGSETVQLPPEKARVLETTETVSSDSGEPITFRRGHRVELLERGPDSWRVRESVRDYTQQPPELVDSKEGWLPLEAVTLRLERTFVRFEYDEDISLTARSHEADGHQVEVQWVRLESDFELFGQQTKWMRYIG